MTGVLPAILRARVARLNLLPANLSNLNNQLHHNRPLNEKRPLVSCESDLFYHDWSG